jgi:DNA-binding response OmpR family regulator
LQANEYIFTVILSLVEIRKERQELHQRLVVLDQMEQELLTMKERTVKPDFSVFTGTTKLLLDAFWKASKNILCPDDIWQDVMFRGADEPDKHGGVRTTVKRARKEMRALCDFHFEIKNIRGQGYQFVEVEVGQRVSTPQKTQRKQRKS